MLQAGLVAGALVGLGLLLRYGGFGDLRALRPTAAGAVVLILGGGLLSAAGLPRQAVAFAGGYVFGAWAGAGLSLVAQILGCVLDYLAARGILAGWANRRLARLSRLAGLRRALRAQPLRATLALRLMPFGNNLLVNLLAGAAGIAMGPFLAGSLIGYVPQTILFALIGSGVQIGRLAQVAAALFLLVAAAGLGVEIWRRQRK